MTRTANDPEVEAAAALVHEGWNHLMSQRPVAAWGTWRRALRLDPESAAAKKALATLESAHELPLAARKAYKLRQPRTADQRRRWDARLQGAAAAAEDDLEAAANAFEALHDDAPDDAEAWFDHGLCLAWMGRDREAVSCLDQVVAIESETHPDGAVDAWTLAEVLRQGGGAEALADDLRYACGFPWDDADAPALFASFPEIRRIPTPQDPTRPDARLADVEVFEWLDRPFPEGGAEHEGLAASQLPRVLATLYLAPGAIRLSSPRVDGLEQAEEKLRLLIGDEAEPLERAAAPLPLPFLDAAVWTVRLPEGHDRADADRWTREVVESYYEDRWIHLPRQGLDGLSPLAAGRNANAGDDAIRAKLTAVLAFREQLGARASSALLYQGYPFDRLRRRLGLDPVDPGSVDAADLSCASLAELAALTPDELDDHQLVEAFQSALGLRDDEIAGPLAEALLSRRPEGLRRIAADALAACLVRRASSARRFDEALQWIDRARPLGTPEQQRTLDVWRAEVLARAGRADDSARVYRDLAAGATAGERARLAIDAAETLIDNGLNAAALEFLDEAATLAGPTGLKGVARRAERLLESAESSRTP